MAGNVPLLLKGGYQSRAARKHNVASGLIHLERQRLDATFACFDRNDSGKLERDEMKSLLQDRNGGVPPDEEDITFVMRTADERKGRGKSLIRRELDAALLSWDSCKSWRDSAEAAINSFGGGSQRLDREGLRQSLAQLSSELGETGRYGTVTDEELEAVLQEACISMSAETMTRPEVGLALAVWQAHVELRLEERARKSRTCVVS